MSELTNLQPENSRIILEEKDGCLHLTMPPLSRSALRGSLLFLSLSLIVLVPYTLMPFQAGFVGGPGQLFSLIGFWGVWLITLLVALRSRKTVVTLCMDKGWFRCTRKGLLGIVTRNWTVFEIQEFSVGVSEWESNNKKATPVLCITLVSDHEYKILPGREKAELQWLAELLQERLKTARKTYQDQPLIDETPPVDGHIEVLENSTSLRVSLSALPFQGRLLLWTSIGGVMLVVVVLTWIVPTIDDVPVALEHPAITLATSLVGLLGLICIVEPILIAKRTFELTVDHDGIELEGRGLIQTTRKRFAREEVQGIEIGQHRLEAVETMYIPTLLVYLPQGRMARWLEFYPEEDLLWLASKICQRLELPDVIPHSLKEKVITGGSTVHSLRANLTCLVVLLLIAGGFYLTFRFGPTRNKEDEQYLHFSFKQPFNTAKRKLPGIRLKLPEGWKVHYNGHQPWRQATLVDENGVTKMEVILFAHANNPQAPANVEKLDLPIGNVIHWQSEREVWWRFNVHDGRESDNAEAVVHDYLIGQHRLTVRILKQDAKPLHELLNQMMKSAIHYRP